MKTTDSETIADVAEAVGRAINQYDNFEVAVTVDPMITARRGWTIGNARIELQRAVPKLVHHVTIGWRIVHADLEVEFLVGEETWLALRDLPLHLYFLAVDIMAAQQRSIQLTK